MEMKLCIIDLIEMLRGEIVSFSCFLMILHHVNSRKKASFFFPSAPQCPVLFSGALPSEHSVFEWLWVS